MSHHPAGALSFSQAIRTWIEDLACAASRMFSLPTQDLKLSEPTQARTLCLLLLRRGLVYALARYPKLTPARPGIMTSLLQSTSTPALLSTAPSMRWLAKLETSPPSSLVSVCEPPRRICVSKLDHRSCLSSQDLKLSEPAQEQLYLSLQATCKAAYPTHLPLLTEHLSKVGQDQFNSLAKKPHHKGTPVPQALFLPLASFHTT